MTTSQGKKQSFSREVNVELILNLLKEHPYSGTELADMLSLSNATVGSIIKDLSEAGAIRINETTSVNGLGRKRVNYELNPEYGLILGINISNFHATVSLINTKQEVIASSDLKVNNYDTKAMYELVLEASKLLINKNVNQIKLRCIVVSLPGRVNSVTGELVLSKQFDEELFKESHYIQRLFEKQFKGVPVVLANDNNVMTIGEANHGALKGYRNGIYFNIDLGIGGGIIIDGKPYVGDLGYAGEFGLIKYFDGNEYLPIDEFASLRALAEKASKLLGREINREDLIEEYEKNPDIKKLVLDTAPIVGETIAKLADVLDISKIVISGRVTKFGDEYLNRIKQECPAVIIHNAVICFSSLESKAVIYGTYTLGLNILFNEIIENRKGEK